MTETACYLEITSAGNRLKSAHGTVSDLLSSKGRFAKTRLSVHPANLALFPLSPSLHPLICLKQTHHYLNSLVTAVIFLAATELLLTEVSPLKSSPLGQLPLDTNLNSVDIFFVVIEQKEVKGPLNA